MHLLGGAEQHADEGAGSAQVPGDVHLGQPETSATDGRVHGRRGAVRGCGARDAVERCAHLVHALVRGTTAGVERQLRLSVLGEQERREAVHVPVRELQQLLLGPDAPCGAGLEAEADENGVRRVLLHDLHAARAERRQLSS
jgi:hypothetical protein